MGREPPTSASGGGGAGRLSDVHEAVPRRRLGPGSTTSGRPQSNPDTPCPLRPLQTVDGPCGEHDTCPVRSVTIWRRPPRGARMTPPDLAAQTVDILARLFKEFPDQLSAHLGGRVADAAVRKAVALYEAVRDRLSPGRQAVLEDVAYHPDDRAAQRALREELVALMAEEP